MRGALLIALLVAGVGCGAGQGASIVTTPSTSLQVSFYPEGRGVGKPAPTTWSLRCNPTAGTLPRRAAACERLGKMSAPFAPLGKGIACTDIYGGPQEAVVSGRYRGNRIWVVLKATNGCEIARWNKLQFLVGGIAAGAGAPS
jgi:hypothetical protein